MIEAPNFQKQMSFLPTMLFLMFLIQKITLLLNVCSILTGFKWYNSPQRNFWIELVAKEITRLWFKCIMCINQLWDPKGKTKHIRLKTSCNSLNKRSQPTLKTSKSWHRSETYSLNLRLSGIISRTKFFEFLKIFTICLSKQEQLKMWMINGFKRQHKRWNNTEISSTKLTKKSNPFSKEMESQ